MVVHLGDSIHSFHSMSILLNDLPLSVISDLLVEVEFHHHGQCLFTALTLAGLTGVYFASSSLGYNVCFNYRKVDQSADVILRRLGMARSYKLAPVSFAIRQGLEACVPSKHFAGALLHASVLFPFYATVSSRDWAAVLTHAATTDTRSCKQLPVPLESLWKLRGQEEGEGEEQVEGEKGTEREGERKEEGEENESDKERLLSNPPSSNQPGRSHAGKIHCLHESSIPAINAPPSLPHPLVLPPPPTIEVSPLEGILRAFDVSLLVHSHQDLLTTEAMASLKLTRPLYLSDGGDWPASEEARMDTHVDAIGLAGNQKEEKEKEKEDPWLSSAKERTQRILVAAAEVVDRVYRIMEVGSLDGREKGGRSGKEEELRQKDGDDYSASSKLASSILLELESIFVKFATPSSTCARTPIGNNIFIIKSKPGLLGMRYIYPATT
eukprot:CAMPEP_0175043658 /NCGR_PEP_ID=MMETSP0052_2-20121109/3325_1 /TAXON_ID=51329 ORGANISM="Polytomella parva, Strain SAG 63-3" /NCGR_SAMPLE_ID=MMETSP0052_2 /ASSEMBLY_ACC=CAM_ASM_000194 /LENGTH=438 /DNA_ID=CAMNT_0016306773 /DNA_START=329 /DNA_END=1645 /DNA_ORIENTATION=-